MELPLAITLQVLPSTDHAERGVLGEDSIVINHELGALIVVDRVFERRRDLGEGRTLGDVIDHATWVALTEEHRGRTLHDFHTLNVVEIVGNVTEDAIAHQCVHREATHREGSLRGSFIGRTTPRETGVTRGSSAVTEDVGDGLGIGVVEELT